MRRFWSKFSFLFQTKKQKAGWLALLAVEGPELWEWFKAMIDAVSRADFVYQIWQFARPHLGNAATVLTSAIGRLCVVLIGLALIWFGRRDEVPAQVALGPDHPEQATARVSDTTSRVSTAEQSTDVSDYQLEASSPDFRAVFQDLPNQSFHVVNPDRENFSHVAWVVGFTNLRQYHCIVRARLIFKECRAGSPTYIHRTVVNGAWLEGTGAEVELADKETRYLMIAVAKITRPAEWQTVEDHRLTAHARLGIEFRTLPLASITIEVTTTLYGGETKQFTFSANLKTFRALATDLTPAK